MVGKRETKLEIDGFNLAEVAVGDKLADVLVAVKESRPNGL